MHQISRSHGLKNRWFRSNLSKITKLVTAIKSLTQCPVFKQLRVKTARTLLFAISWTCSGHRVTRAHVRFCWVPSHCGIDGNERVDQLTKETLDQDVDPLASVHYTDMKPQAVGLFFDLEKAYETTWQYGIIRDLHRIGLRGRLPVFVSEYLRDRRIRVRIGTTLWRILPRGRCSNWRCPGCDMFWMRRHDPTRPLPLVSK